MKQVLAALLCLAALHALTAETSTPEALLRALDQEAHEKLWKQPDEWQKEHPGQKAFEAWQNARVEQWGLDILKRYTELFERYPNAEFIWQQKQSAQRLWSELQSLKRPKYQQYLDEWKVRWPGDNVIERRFYTSRLRELAKQYPDKEDAEKIARALRAEFPVRREPYRALLSIAQRKSQEAYAAELQDILKSAGTPETVKAYLQGKAGDAKREDEPYDYHGERERGDKEIDHYEIRDAQISSRHPESLNWLEKHEKSARALIAEFPEQTRPYGTLYWLAGRREDGQDLGATRTWLLEFVKGPAPDAVKTELQENYWGVILGRACHENFWLVMCTDNVPKKGECKSWLEKYEPLWRTYLEAYGDFIEGRLTCSKNKDVQRDAIWLLTQLSHVTTDPEYRRHLKTLNANWLTLPVWSDEERVKLRGIQLYAQAADISEAVVAESKINHPALNVYPPDVCEKVTRTLMKEFPQQAQPYEDFLIIARHKGTMERPLLQEILDSSPAPDSVKNKVRNVIGQMNRIGQPLELTGTSVDGRAIDVRQMKGKVVLIDFWATWCGPCLAEVPRIKSLYEKTHERGFEVIGISLDKTPEALKTYLEKNPSPWPQHWNKAWNDFGINSIPTMWLVDKKGIVRDVDARKDLDQKVERLLAEP